MKIKTKAIKNLNAAEEKINQAIALLREAELEAPEHRKPRIKEIAEDASLLGTSIFGLALTMENYDE